MEQSAASTAAASGARRMLYPENEPYAFGWLPAQGGHEIYYEECGKRNGRPVVILHGGPGGATNPTMRRFFDPGRSRVGRTGSCASGRDRRTGAWSDWWPRPAHPLS